MNSFYANQRLLSITGVNGCFRQRMDAGFNHPFRLPNRLNAFSVS